MAKYNHQIKSRHHKLVKMAGINEPPDGFTDEEKAIARLVTENTIVDLYNRLPTDRLKLICVMYFEQGYTQTTIADLLGGLDQSTINWHIRMIRRLLLGKRCKPHIKRQERYNKVDVVDVLATMYSMHN